MMTVDAALKTRLKAAIGVVATGLVAASYSFYNDGDRWLVGIAGILSAAALAELAPNGRTGRILGLAALTVAAPVLLMISFDPIDWLLLVLMVFGAYHWMHWRRETPKAPTAVEPTPAASRHVAGSPAGGRLPAGVADERLLDRLAVHEMTRARRYEHPLTLLLVDIDGWSVLAAERGKRGALDQVSMLAIRIRRLLRDVDAIGLHGEGQLAILLPETPLDGALVVAGRIEEAARDDVRVSVRVGAAVFPEDAVSVDGLLHEAEAALELARLEGVAVAQRVQLS